MMFHYYFLANDEGLVFDVLDDTFERALLAPLREYLELRGVSFDLGRRAMALSRAESHGPAGTGSAPTTSRWRVSHEESDGSASAREQEADLVVLGLNVSGLRSLIDASPAVGDPSWRSRVGSLRETRPFAVWRLWLDRPTAEGRAAFVGTAGFPLLDNISLYHLFEAESSNWADRTGGSVVELHAYGMPESVTEAEIRRSMLSGLHELIPETQGAGVVHQEFFVERDCPAFPPSGHSQRPGVETPEPGLALAGDFVRMDFPTALMERATASGFLAASVLLRPYGVRPEPLRSVAPRGPIG
jgi:carotenoid phi-ring synthase / carotenoid chi-ring synthase